MTADPDRPRDPLAVAPAVEVKVCPPSPEEPGGLVVIAVTDRAVQTATFLTVKETGQLMVNLTLGLQKLKEMVTAAGGVWPPALVLLLALAAGCLAAPRTRAEGGGSDLGDPDGGWAAGDDGAAASLLGDYAITWTISPGGDCETPLIDLDHATVYEDAVVYRSDACPAVGEVTVFASFWPADPKLTMEDGFQVDSCDGLYWDSVETFTVTFADGGFTTDDDFWGTHVRASDVTNECTGSYLVTGVQL